MLDGLSSAATCCLLLTLVAFCDSCARSEQDRMNRWVRDVASRNVSVSMHAQKELIARGSDALPIVEQALRHSESDAQTSLLLVVLGNIDPNRYAEILCQYAFSPTTRYNIVLRYVNPDIIARMDIEHRRRLAEMYSPKLKEAKDIEKHALSNLMDSLNQETPGGSR